ncbi:MAG TPA: hypothetical protein PK364_14270, partial [Synergistaceae bacterium]|nr:hypothetical protein [Synergistaceae bacterium]
AAWEGKGKRKSIHKTKVFRKRREHVEKIRIKHHLIVKNVVAKKNAPARNGTQKRNKKQGENAYLLIIH